MTKKATAGKEPTSVAERAAALARDWGSDSRWEGVERPYSATDVVKLQGSRPPRLPDAIDSAEKLWRLLTTTEYVRALGAMTGGQAVQMARAGLQAIYLSGWQVAADANLAGETYPDQSLYPANSAPALVRRIVAALRRADEVQWSDGGGDVDFFLPIVADAEAGFGGALNVFEIMKAMLEAGAAGVHFEDQLASEKKCGHMGGKVLVPTAHHIRTLTAARLAADVLGVPAIVVARTDANAATLLTSDVDERDHPFLTGTRTAEGFYVVAGGLDSAIARSLAYAPYADVLWCETAHPDLVEAGAFADAIHAVFPGKLLAYNCSPSFNWRRHLDKSTIARFQKDLAAMGFKYQFITLAGFHALNASMFQLASRYAESGMPAYVQLQEQEFAMEADGYTATRHQHEVGASYFDLIAEVVGGEAAATLALHGSTEEEQFE